MIQSFKAILSFFSNIIQLIYQIFQGFWEMLANIGRSISWITSAIILMPTFVQGSLLAILGIMVVYLIISRGGSDN